MLNTLIGIETNILKETPCSDVYLQNNFLCSKNYQNIVVSVWERRKRFMCTYFLGPMTRITTLPSKLRKITLAYYKEMPLMFFCLYSIRVWCFVPSSDRNFVHLKKLPGLLQILSFVCISVHFLLHRKSIEASTFYSQSWKGTVWLLEMMTSPVEKENTKFPI